MSSLEFRLKRVDETKNYLLEKIKHNDLVSEKYKKSCKYLNYVEGLIILASKVNSWVSVSSFDPLVCVPVGIASSVVRTKNCAIAAEVNRHKSITKKKKKEVW